MVEDATAGMVWAPEAIWDPAKGSCLEAPEMPTKLTTRIGQYLVHWASKFYPASDSRHTGSPSNIRIRYAYTIEVENLRDAPQTVLVRDQLPVSRHEQIKVRLDSAEPKPDKHTDLNQLEWKLTLDPRAKQTVRFAFSVESPRTMDVVGLT